MLAPLRACPIADRAVLHETGPTTVEQENEAQAAQNPEDHRYARRLHLDRRPRGRVGSASAGAVVRAADRAFVLDLVRLGAEPAAAGHGVLGRGPRLHRDVCDLVRPGRRRAPPRAGSSTTRRGWRSSGRACTSATPTSRGARIDSWRRELPAPRGDPGAPGPRRPVLLLPDRRRRRAQRRTSPPSTHSVCPVIAPAASLARNATAAATSSGLSGAVDRLARPHLRERLGRRVGDRGRRRGQARRHAVDGDPVAPERAGQRAGDPDQRGLAGDVGEQVGRRRIPHRVRDDEHDPPEAALGHPGGERLGQPQRRLDVDRLDAAPRSRSRSDSGARSNAAAAWTSTSQRPCAFEHPRRRRLDVVAVGEIDRADRRRGRARRRCGRLLEGGGDRAADRAGAAGDDRDPTHGRRPWRLQNVAKPPARRRPAAT